MRGKPESAFGQTPPPRITPAGAGKTNLRSGKLCTTRDHPRRCGENSDWDMLHIWRAGSPPQVRGKLAYPNRIPSPRRITPAGAEKTVMALVDITSLQDHPRRCGENPLTQARRVVCIGSPPQVRGKLFYLNLLP